MGMSLQTIIYRDKELTQFKHFVLEHPEKTIDQAIDDFGFQMFNVENKREHLASIGRDARRYPHRVPQK